MRHVGRVIWTLGLTVVLWGCAEEDAETLQPEPTEKPEVARLASAVAGSGDGTEVVRVRSSKSGAFAPLRVNGIIREGDEMAVAPGGSALVTLIGGTRLSCRDGTALRFSTAGRVVIRSGAIWVEDRAPGPARPFGIDTPAGAVLTSGAVAAAERLADGIKLSVISGTATIQGAQGPRPVPGGQGALLKDDGTVEMRPVENAAALVAWTRNLREMSAPSIDPIRAAFPRPDGLGSLTAKAPGTRAPLPFHILSQEVDVMIQDNIARTTVEQRFQNPTAQVVEATYKFPIPGGAVLTRYDMEVKGKMMKGEIVERSRGRRIMKQIIHEYLDRLRDPALVEWESGSTFKTRIFPIQPKEKKRIVLSYLQPLAGGAGDYLYTLPTAPAGASSPQIPDFSLNVVVNGGSGRPQVSVPLFDAQVVDGADGARVIYHAKPFAPKTDLAVRVRYTHVPEARIAVSSGDQPLKKPALLPPPATAPPALAAGDERFFLMTLEPELPAVTGGTEGADWILLVDTSLSRTPVDQGVQAALVDSLLGAMGYGDRFRLLAYDWTARALQPDWRTADDGARRDAVTFLNGQGLAGATNLADALKAASEGVVPARATRILLIGDGSATLGERRPAVLGELAARYFNDPKVSVHAIGVGAGMDEIALREITRRCRGRILRVSTGEDLLAAAVRIVTGLRAPLLENPILTFSDPAVADVVPAALSPIAPGEELVVTGRLGRLSALTARLEGTYGGMPWSKEYRFSLEGAGNNGFIPKLWAAGKIDALTLDDSPEGARRTVSLSKKHGVPSRLTSFIVLENDAMYRELRVAQTAEQTDWEPGEGPVYREAEGDDDVPDALSEAGEPALKIADEEISALAGPGAGVSSGAPARRAKASAPAMEQKKTLAPPNAKTDDGWGPVPSFPAAYSIKEPWYRPVCRSEYRYDVEIWKRPLAETPSRLAQLQELFAALSQSPLSRNARRKHLGLLMRLGRTREGLTVADQWLAIERTDPDALRAKGDLQRLTGDLDGAVRTLSGMLDVQPEDAKIAEYLATLLESRGRSGDAYPFRSTLSVLKPRSWELKGERALAAARAGRMDEAAWMVVELCEARPDGSIHLKPGVKLSAPLKGKVFHLAAEGRLPDESPPSLQAAESARFSIALTWQGPGDLDLVVTLSPHRALGGENDDYQMLTSSNGLEGERFYGNQTAPGNYTLSAVCARPAGCAGISGQLKVRVRGKSQTLPFTIEDTGGRELALIRVERRPSRCAYLRY